MSGGAKKKELKARIAVLEQEVATLRRLLASTAEGPIDARPYQGRRMEWYPPTIPDPSLGRGRGYYDQFGTVWW